MPRTRIIRKANMVGPNFDLILLTFGDILILMYFLTLHISMVWRIELEEVKLF